MKIDWDIIDTIEDEVSFFVDQHDSHELYVEYTKGSGVTCFSSMKSKDFESFFRCRYSELSNSRDIPNLTPVLTKFRDRASNFGGVEVVEPYTRIAGNLKDGLEYFLANTAREVVSVQEGSWKVSKQADHKFLTRSAHGTQVLPTRSDKNLLDLLKPCVNLQDDDLMLFTIWLIQSFSGGSHYGLMLEAARGSGKSTLTKIANLLIDPSRADAVTMQHKLDDFQTFLANHYLACFDNVRNIPTDHSDVLCTAITGGTVVKRELFTTNDLAYCRLHNAVIINGINVFPAESDLADRFLFFHLNKIEASGRKTDHVIREYIQDTRPLMLGCIFDVLAKASVIPEEDPPEKTRMADAYVEMLAIARVLGLSAAEFQRLITENIAKMHRACAASPLVEAICEYMNGPKAGKRKVTESSTEFFTHVRNNYSGRKNTLGPRAAEFSKRLKMEHDALYAAGFSSIVDGTGPVGSTITIIREIH